jgi:hypothetical protein
MTPTRARYRWEPATHAVHYLHGTRPGVWRGIADARDAARWILRDALGVAEATPLVKAFTALLVARHVQHPAAVEMELEEIKTWAASVRQKNMKARDVA